MKNTLIFFIFILSILFWQGLDIYSSVQTDKQKGLLEKMEIVRQETDLSITEVARFHGDQLYYVFTGYDPEQEENSYIFLNESHHLAQISFTDIQTTKELATSNALQKFPDLVEISRVIPAAVNNQFVWEIIGYDGENNLHYIYYTMQEGSFLKRYTVNPFTK